MPLECYAVICPKCKRVQLFLRGANILRVFCDRCEIRIDTSFGNQSVDKFTEPNIKEVTLTYGWDS